MIGGKDGAERRDALCSAGGLSLFWILTCAAETKQFWRVDVAKIGVRIIRSTEDVPILYPTVENSCFAAADNVVKKLPHILAKIDYRIMHFCTFCGCNHIGELVSFPKLPFLLWGQFEHQPWKTSVANITTKDVRWRSAHISNFQNINQVLPGEHFFRSKLLSILMKPTPLFVFTGNASQFRYNPRPLRIDRRFRLLSEAAQRIYRYERTNGPQSEESESWPVDVPKWRSFAKLGLGLCFVLFGGFGVYHCNRRIVSVLCACIFLVGWFLMFLPWGW